MPATPYEIRVAEVIRKLAADAAWSKRALSIATGIPRETLARKLTGLAPFTTAELANLGLAFGELTPADILRMAEAAA